MGRPRSITLLALATSAVSGVIVGWEWRGPNASAALSRVLGAKPGQASALHPDAPTAAASLAAARSAVNRADLVVFLEALEGAAAPDLPGLWATCAEAFREIPGPSEATERMRALARALGLPIGLAKDPPM